MAAAARPGLMSCCSALDVHAVNGDTGLGERVTGLDKVEPGLADLHAGAFGFAEYLVSVIDGGRKLRQLVPDLVGGR